MKKLLVIVVLGLLLGGNANAGWFGKWSGYVYPDASDLTVHVPAGTHLDEKTFRDYRSGFVVEWVRNHQQTGIHKRYN